MATDTVGKRILIQSENTSSELKYLGFMRIAAINSLEYLTKFYDRAKQNSGSLKSGVESVEGTVTTIIGPVREKYKNVPKNFLAYLDKKVDGASNKFDKHAPALAKKVVSKSLSVLQKTSQVTKTLVTEARTNGPSAAANQAGTQFKQFLLIQAVKGWSRLNQIPSVQKVIPMLTQLSEKYNTVVAGMVKKGYPIVSNIPLVPIEKIGKVFNQSETVEKESSEVGSEGGDVAAVDVVATVQDTITAAVDTVTE
ncbi:hypothetical protein HHK36_029338 [Tetracentron sinense]|uniref:Uncharacterized protein n=1 Tax=Tetracentron sinense TaxID=13715 RepID=A0A834YCT3_TETSI|nr:hypothetical protein HHK36_029338 [Tetracentron sinense]